jgi:hypothetical protein
MFIEKERNPAQVMSEMEFTPHRLRRKGAGQKSFLGIG